MHLIILFFYKIFIMSNLLDIKNNIKQLHNYYNNKIKFKKEINQIQNYLLNLKLNNNDKYILLNLLLEFKINNEFINKIKNKYNIKVFYYTNEYDYLIHDYLYYKIFSNYVLFRDIEKIEDRILKYHNKIIINEIIKINNFIDNNNFLEIIKNESIIYFNDKEKYYYDDYYEIYDKKIDIIQKIKYPLTLTQYYDNNTLNVYQCWFKSAINFFVNNGNFINQFINNKINIDFNILSDVIDSEKIKGGNNKEIYELFKNMFNNENNIENYYIQLKRILNDKLNNKYYLGIPGYKIYPFYVIQDILFLLNDYFTKNCIIEYDNEFAYKDNFKSYIYDCNTNYFLNDLELLYNTQIKNKDEFNIYDLDYDNLKKIKLENCDDNEINNPLCNNKLSTINFTIKNYKYYYEDNILNYIHHIKNNPINLLIASPIHDIIASYMLNNKFKFCNYNYDEIKNNIIKLNEMYDINIIYPFIINLNNNNYKLHSFIIVVNNKKVDSHFVYYKLDNNDLLRYDTFKIRLNKDNINNLSINLLFIKDEFNNIYNNNCIIDNLNYKIVFCYYRLIN